MKDTLNAIVESSTFQYFILFVILVAAFLVGLETFPEMRRLHGEQIAIANRVVLWIFVAEAAIKMARHGRYFYRYFTDPWNVFDFLIVVVCFLPVNAQYAAVLRLARIMRVMRLMTALPQLQLIVGALIKSIPSMGYVGILLLLNFYVYAVLGVFLYSENDPIHFRDLQTAMLSLFRVVTLEDWTDVMYINMYGSDLYPGPTIESYQASNSTGITPNPDTIPGPLIGALFFVSFVLFGTMIMLNLFIGIILNSMDETRDEQATERSAEAGNEPSVAEEMALLEKNIDEMKASLTALRKRVERESG